MKIRLLKFVALIPLLFLAAATQITPAHAYTNSNLIDDSVFDNTNSMSASAIQSFFNANYPSGCLTNYQAPDPQSWSGYGGNVSAAQAIYDSAHIWGINPQVILTTLEKEEGLVSGHGTYGCSQTAFNSAMGYDCPGGIQPATGTCVAHASNLGFSAQVNHGAWQLEFGRYRSEGDGNLGYDGDGNITFYGYMTQGTRPRCSGCASQYYSGTVTLDDNTTLSLANGATASLYSYTPFLQSFSRIFEQFFGVGSTTVNAYQWQFVNQTTNRDLGSLPAGETARWTLTALNTGSATWTNNGANPINLGTDYPRDRSSPFYSTKWLGQARPVGMTESSVPPGSTGTFNFEVQAPPTPGDYLEHFNLVADGITWMNDPGLAYAVHVVPANLTTTVISDTTPATMTAGATASATITVRNDGNEAWYSDGRFPITLGTTNPHNRSSAFADTSWPSALRVGPMGQDAVGIGQNATFTFVLKAPAYNDTYEEDFSPVEDGLGWSPTTIAHSITVTGGSANPPVPVYRLYNPIAHTHFFTSSTAERDSVESALGFSYEGIAFYASNTVTSTPVYRLYNPYSQTHFFTGSPAERDSAERLGFGYEGIAFYALQ